MADDNHRPGEALPTTKLEKHERYLSVNGAFLPHDRTRQPPGTADTPVPWVRLRGKWLRDAGFEVDAQVRVRIMAGCLVLTTD
ncbi:type I toxin-antitoxin system SymE family toxin [Aquabacterium sp. A7-Y]|uniref:SymE family type I addiction module toxin n=1 Tax=Aquabacterium sp. A7-Y TaxID=1349605 RepID=UPI00223D9FC8|nr:SymE family type I addiction module toxin [Aquabacterium sp. A7-Y]MCW7536270.1 type I toxin-antitoxin system SymE family toxin [Aquabacterium sp. A7-Y]